jgi:hypothetical protein
MDCNLRISFTRNGVCQKELWVKLGLESHPDIFVALCLCTMASLRLAVLLMVYDVLLYDTNTLECYLWYHCCLKHA